MSKKLIFVLALASSAPFSVSAEECKPVVGDPREVATIVSGSETNGSQARAEILETLSEKDVHVESTVDLFGRLLAISTRKQIGEKEVLIQDGNYAMARIDRYCSKSNAKSAKCASLCVRWTNYEDERR